MTSLAEFFSRPMSAGPNQYPVGKDELGGTAYRTPLGETYSVQPRDGGGDFRLKDLFDGGGFSDQVRQGAGGLSDGNPDAAGWLTEGVTAPGKALRGEPVTYGDVGATALDWGILSAPMPKPEGALGAGMNFVGPPGAPGGPKKPKKVYVHPDIPLAPEMLDQAAAGEIEIVPFKPPSPKPVTLPAPPPPFGSVEPAPLPKMPGPDQLPKGWGEEQLGLPLIGGAMNPPPLPRGVGKFSSYPGERAAEEVAGLLQAGRADEITDDLYSRTLPARGYLTELYDIPTDTFSRGDRAEVAGFPLRPETRTTDFNPAKNPGLWEEYKRAKAAYEAQFDDYLNAVGAHDWQMEEMRLNGASPKDLLAMLRSRPARPVGVGSRPRPPAELYDTKDILTGDVQYHGTRTDFDQFRGPTHVTPDTVKGGNATYMAENPEFASKWAGAGDNAMVYPVVHNVPEDQILKIWEEDHIARIKDYLDAQGDPGKYDGKLAYAHQYGDWGAIEDPVVMKGAYGAGFRGFNVSETPLGTFTGRGMPSPDGGMPESMNTGIFNPRNVRSVNAMFDPRLAHLRNLLASGAPTVALADLFASQGADDPQRQPER